MRFQARAKRNGEKGKMAAATSYPWPSVVVYRGATVVKRRTIVKCIGIGIGGAMAPPTIWLIAGQRAQDTAYQQIFHRLDWVNLWNFMNRQLSSMLYLTYCSFYSQETSCLIYHSLVDAKMGVVRRNCGCGRKNRARFVCCSLLAPPTLYMFLRLWNAIGVTTLVPCWRSWVMFYMYYIWHHILLQWYSYFCFLF